MKPSTMIALRVALALAGACVGTRALAAQTIADLGTLGFRAEADLAYWSVLARSPCPQIKWSPDVMPGGSFAAATLPIRTALMRRVGYVPAARRGAVQIKRRVYENSSYSIDFVQFAGRVPTIAAFGYLASPKTIHAEGSPAVILLHGSGTLPEQLFGWRFDVGGRIKYEDELAIFKMGITLVEAGYTVFAPWINDDDDFAPTFPWLTVDKRGNLLQHKTGRGGAYSFVASDVLGAVDFVSTLEGVNESKVVIGGWAEGSQIASVAAALDPRIMGVFKLGPPIDWNRYRNSGGAPRVGAPFTHMDCALGDPELAALVAPRPTLYAYSRKGVVYQTHLPFVGPNTLKRIAGVYQAAGAPDKIETFVTDSVAVGAINSVTMATLRWLGNITGHDRRGHVLTGETPLQPKDEKYPLDLIASKEADVSTYVSSLGACPALPFTPILSSTAAYAASVRQVRAIMAQRGGFNVPTPGAGVDTLERHVVHSTAAYTLEYMKLRMRATGWEVRGLLATPRIGTNYPAVLSLDGVTSLPLAFGFPPLDAEPYLNGYADQLARSGVAVFALYYPGWFTQVASAVMHARNPGGTGVWDFIVGSSSAGVDVLWNMPGVDRTRIASRGISFSGYASLLIGAVDDRVSSVIYTNVPNDEAFLFDKGPGALTQTWWTDLCSVTPVLFQMIAPKRFVWEAGEDPDFQNANWEQVVRIRQIYEQLGISDHFQFVRHGGGHETRLDNSLIFPPGQP